MFSIQSNQCYALNTRCAKIQTAPKQIMGIIDEIFRDDVFDDKQSRINYTAPKMEIDGKKLFKATKKSKEGAKKIKQCAAWIYINSIEWCAAMKGTHIHQKCMEEIFDNIDTRLGVPYSEYIDTLSPDWDDYWYNPKNHKYYTRQQLKKIEKEFNKGRRSEELVQEMLEYVWLNMIPEYYLFEEIDEASIFKLRIKHIK